MAFLERLSQLVKQFGDENVVYFDESGFDKHSVRKHGWVLRGQKIFADVLGKREKRTNLIMGNGTDAGSRRKPSRGHATRPTLMNG